MLDSRDLCRRAEICAGTNSRGCFTSERKIEGDSRSCYCCMWCIIVKKISTNHLILIRAVVRIIDLITLWMEFIILFADRGELVNALAMATGNISSSLGVFPQRFSGVSGKGFKMSFCLL